MLNASDSREELGKIKSVLKGGIMTALWSDATNYLELEESTEKSVGGGTQSY